MRGTDRQSVPNGWLDVVRQSAFSKLTISAIFFNYCTVRVHKSNSLTLHKAPSHLRDQQRTGCLRDHCDRAVGTHFESGYAFLTPTGPHEIRGAIVQWNYWAFM